MVIYKNEHLEVHDQAHFFCKLVVGGTMGLHIVPVHRQAYQAGDIRGASRGPAGEDFVRMQYIVQEHPLPQDRTFFGATYETCTDCSVDVGAARVHGLLVAC